MTLVTELDAKAGRAMMLGHQPQHVIKQHNTCRLQLRCVHHPAGIVTSMIFWFYQEVGKQTEWGQGTHMWRSTTELLTVFEGGVSRRLLSVAGCSALAVASSDSYRLVCSEKLSLWRRGSWLGIQDSKVRRVAVLKTVWYG